MSLAIWIVLAACAVAVVTDVAYRRIPNALTIALALAALGLHATQGVGSFASSVGAMLIVTVLGFGAFSMGWLGGGDVKLAAAGAAAFGLPDALPFLLYTALGGGLLAVAVSLFTGRLNAVTRSVALLVRPFAYKGTVAVAPASPVMLPYAVAIACGAGAVALSHTAAPFLRLAL
ncbi:MAG: prepilin peptidase [Candidatus Eremiobacteraeota bacterium]|nr:prepilin peptidase [Candidatus Eremiobacteraeota bacterium]